MKHILNKGRIKPIILTFGLLILALSLSIPKHKAYADSFNLGVYPPIVNLTLKPPVTVSTPITLSNLGNSITQGTIVFRLFDAGENQDGQLNLLPQNTKPEPDEKIFSKIHLTDNGKPVTSFALAPGQQKKYNLSFSIPINEPLSDYYFSVIFIANSSLSNSNTSTGALGGVSTNVLLSIGPKGSASAKIIDFSSPTFLSSGPVPFILKVKNTSPHVLAPQGYILISNMFGQTVGKINLLPVNILSGSTRAIPDSSNSQAIPAVNPLLNSIPIAIWPETFLLGSYKATVKLALTNNGPIISSSTHFFA